MTREFAVCTALIIFVVFTMGVGPRLRMRSVAIISALPISRWLGFIKPENTRRQRSSPSARSRSQRRRSGPTTQSSPKPQQPGRAVSRSGPPPTPRPSHSTNARLHSWRRRSAPTTRMLAHTSPTCIASTWPVKIVRRPDAIVAHGTAAARKSTKGRGSSLRTVLGTQSNLPRIPDRQNKLGHHRISLNFCDGRNAKMAGIQSDGAPRFR
jgi:hypothetical protein